jgi:hypothetical protein
MSKNKKKRMDIYKFVNLTEHDIDIVDGDKILFTLHPSGLILRADENKFVDGEIVVHTDEGEVVIPHYYVDYSRPIVVNGETKDITELEFHDGVLYVVSSIAYNSIQKYYPKLIDYFGVPTDMQYDIQNGKKIPKGAKGIGQRERRSNIRKN